MKYVAVCVEWSVLTLALFLLFVWFGAKQTQYTYLTFKNEQKTLRKL